MPTKDRATPRCPEFNSIYSAGCRCSFCRENHRRQRNEQRLRELARQRGVPLPYDKLDVAEVRDLLNEASRNGATDRELERITGVNRSNIYDIRTDSTKYVRRITRDKVVSALSGNSDLRAFTKGTLVPVGWSRAMIYGLCAQGWPIYKQQEIIRTNLNRPVGFFRSATNGKHDSILYSNEQALRWLVRQLGDSTGPNKRTAKWAAREGYFPAKHYDNDGKLVVKSLPKELRQKIEGV